MSYLALMNHEFVWPPSKLAVKNMWHGDKWQARKVIIGQRQLLGFSDSKKSLPLFSSTSY